MQNRKTDAPRQKWYQRKLVWVILAVVAIGIVFAINEAYKAETGYITKWDAKDVLSFYGSVLALLGTLVLGYIAYKQNSDAGEMNERLTTANEKLMETNSRLLQLEEDRHILELRPFALLIDWAMYAKSYNEIMFEPDKLYVDIGSKCEDADATCMRFEFANTTQSYISVEYAGVSFWDDDASTDWTHGYTNIQKRKLILPAGASDSIVFYGHWNAFQAVSGRKLRFNFVLENRFGARYRETFAAMLMISDLDQRRREPFLSVLASDYLITKFERNEDGRIQELKENGDPLM